MNKNYLAEEKLGTLLLKFSIPCILSLLISSLYNIVDQIFIGHAVGYLGNGATNVVFPITIIALSLALFIGDGSAALLSICSGKKDYESGRKSVGSAVTLMIMVSIALTLVAVLNKEAILWRFGATENNIRYAIEYMNYILIGIPFFILANSINSIIRADGSPQYAMGSMFIGAIVNIVLDAIFIFVFNWGMMGAGLATSIGQVISAAVSCRYLFRMNTFTLGLQDLVPNAIIGKFLPLGVSSFITQISIVITFTVMNNVLVTQGALSKYGSDIPLTAFGIVTKVFQIVISVIVGIAIGAQPIVGFNLGAGKYDRIKSLYALVLKAEIIFATISTLAFELFPSQILGLFGTENNLYLAFGVKAFRIYLAFVILCAVQKSSSIFLQALGKPVLSMGLSLLRDIVLVLPLIFIMTNIMGVEGILFTAPIADLISFLATALVMIYIMKGLGKESEENKINIVALKKAENLL
ncbi:MATE family efflux transporter [Clostridia bacterium]|nr:MATE family efflux transporter [Clostridia bacterium]